MGHDPWHKVHVFALRVLLIEDAIRLLLEGAAAKAVRARVTKHVAVPTGFTPKDPITIVTVIGVVVNAVIIKFAINSVPLPTIRAIEGGDLIAAVFAVSAIKTIDEVLPTANVRAGAIFHINKTIRYVTARSQKRGQAL